MGARRRLLPNTRAFDALLDECEELKARLAEVERARDGYRTVIEAESEVWDEATRERDEARREVVELRGLLKRALVRFRDPNFEKAMTMDDELLAAEIDAATKGGEDER